ncbi:MAG: helix-turn-helix domain-containing protein [Dysosmobacter welbionis]|uniref:helix-turn-helix domain-containing protein n=1 Tax=Dysosmobacter welbionis TaxID=2093857 RepID=UPI003993C41A
MCQGGIACFPKKIRQLRKDRHLTQAEVAKEVGLSARGYQDLELGAKPRYDALLHIADFYDVSVDWLMGRTDNPHAHR